jgi:predicted DNA-binding transcriptional regulator
MTGEWQMDSENTTVESSWSKLKSEIASGNFLRAIRVASKMFCDFVSSLVKKINGKMLSVRTNSKTVPQKLPRWDNESNLNDKESNMNDKNTLHEEKPEPEDTKLGLQTYDFALSSEYDVIFFYEKVYEVCSKVIFNCVKKYLSEKSPTESKKFIFSAMNSPSLEEVSNAGDFAKKLKEDCIKEIYIAISKIVEIESIAKNYVTNSDKTSIHKHVNVVNIVNEIIKKQWEGKPVFSAEKPIESIVYNIMISVNKAIEELKNKISGELERRASEELGIRMFDDVASEAKRADKTLVGNGFLPEDLVPFPNVSSAIPK